VARTINPVNTMQDGDITFAISLGNEKALVDEVGVAAAEVLAMAVLLRFRGRPGLRRAPSPPAQWRRRPFQHLFLTRR